MLAADEDALLCDFVETYHITDMRALPIPLWATLASGLRDDSRIRMKLSGSKITMSEMLQAIAVDRLGRLFWIVSGHAKAKDEPPASILDILLGREPEEPEDKGLTVFDSPDDFNRRWKEITGNGN